VDLPEFRLSGRWAGAGSHGSINLILFLLLLAKEIIKKGSQYWKKDHRDDPQYFFLRVFATSDNIVYHNDIDNEYY